MDLTALSQAIVEGNAGKVKDISQKLLNQGIDPEIILHEGLMQGMKKVSSYYKEQYFHIPQVLLSSRAMHAGLNIIEPLVVTPRKAFKGIVVIGTVAGDLHDIGKNLVGLLLKASGFKVIDLGIDVTAECFLEALDKHHPDILAMSALLTTTMPVMAETMRLLKKEGFREKVKVMVGGAPVTREYARAVGADGYGSDAKEAVSTALKLVERN